jgi:hypothetical protein
MEKLLEEILTEVTKDLPALPFVELKLGVKPSGITVTSTMTSSGTAYLKATGHLNDDKKAEIIRIIEEAAEEFGTKVNTILYPDRKIEKIVKERVK